MPKPTRKEILAILTRNSSNYVKSADLETLVDAAWAERERLDRYINHLAECNWWLPRQEGGGGCTCGLYALLDGPRVVLSAEGSDVPSGDDLEEYNQEQRIRREAYALALEHAGSFPVAEARERAARVYPLRRRVPKVIPDPHDSGAWRVADGPAPGSHANFQRQDGPGEPFKYPNAFGTPKLILTQARVRALAALLDDPFTVEESTEVEE